ncbi:MAG: hypothetical protein QOJ13_3807 [Gaiellales bacterium]|nr:hypothetical protein [Gaiellales bacterium]MDX6594611.1 hypothetical protein [Gaiellales bacterium]
MTKREHDAVREARDALVIVAAMVPPAAVIAFLMGLSADSFRGPFLWLVGTLGVASVLLACVASALLFVDRIGRRWWSMRPYPVRKIQLIPASVGVALLMIAGLPVTLPIIIGFAGVAVLLGAAVAVGAALDL